MYKGIHLFAHFLVLIFFSLVKKLKLVLLKEYTYLYKILITTEIILIIYDMHILLCYLQELVQISFYMKRLC